MSNGGNVEILDKFPIKLQVIYISLYITYRKVIQLHSVTFVGLSVSVAPLFSALLLSAVLVSCH